MKTTGYALREAIKQHELRRDAAARNFNDTLRVFQGETKEAPDAVVAEIQRAEVAIAKLQTAQGRYNLSVLVTFDGGQITLSEAIKLVGGIARIEKMWRSASGPKEDRYGYREELVRDPNQIRATPGITPKDAVKRASEAGKRAGALRQAIATGNAVSIEIESLDPALFE